jgi:ribose 5-phosphate isomerase A
MSDGEPWITDEGNLILDCRRDDWSDPIAQQRVLADMPGVVEHGLFLGMAAAAYVAAAGGVRVIDR